MNTKSATTAGLLGIFLGGFGAHNWYLGEKGKGIAHVCMMAGGILVEVVASIVLPNVLTLSMLFTAASILSVLGGIAALAMSASGIWGFVEGIQILVGGDAGLAAKGYPVATPVNNFNQNYGPSYNQPQNFGPQNYGGQPQNFNQPQNYGGQPIYGQPQSQNFNSQPMNQPMQNPTDQQSQSSNGELNNGQ